VAFATGPDVLSHLDLYFNIILRALHRQRVVEPLGPRWPWLSVEVRGNSVRVVAGAYASPDSPDALINQLQDARELFVSELPPRRASSARAVRRAPSTDPVANVLRSCASLEAFH